MNLTKIPCVKCGNEITGGFYNAPSGPHCCDCWENKVDKKTKNSEVKKAAERVIAIACGLKRP